MTSFPQPAVPVEELERFREEWRKEVKDRTKPAERLKQAPASKPPHPPPAPQSPVRVKAPLSPPQGTKEWQVEETRMPLGPVTSPKAPRRTEHAQSRSQTSKAVELYGRAVDSEQSGQLNEALHLYRKAFRLDGTWDREKVSSSS
jgi:F-box protein 9